MTTMETTTDAGTLRSYNPATGEEVGSVPVTPAGEIDRIIARARGAQPAWAALGAAGRAAMLTPIAEILLSRAEELGELLSREQGKPIPEGIGEVRVCGEALKTEPGEIVDAIAPRSLEEDGVRSTIYHDPYGVCAAITPWNFPMKMIEWMVIPALVAGNTVVLKPSEQTPLIADAYARILMDHLPEGVLSIVHGEGDQGRALVAGDVDLIAFTGSKRTGQLIYESAAKSLKRVILELGSKDPLLVLEGADLDAAAEFAARNAIRNCGQVCVSTERIYVQESVKPAFMDKLVEHVGSYKVGACDEEGVRVGPMVMRAQKDHVLAQVEDALAKGAIKVYGGEPMEGNFVAPTVLDRCTHDMDIMRVETFGPIVCVQGVKDSDEGVERANDTEYGLGAVVFGEDAQAREVGRRLTAGMVGVNRPLYGVKGMPWVGARHSGIGYHMGPMGHRQFCQVRVVSTVES